MFKQTCIRKAKGKFNLYLKQNKHDKKILFYILCGYKKTLYKKVFARIDKYFNLDADVCLVTSGKFDKEIMNMAAKRGWCYLSTTVNNISLAQNATLFSFDKASIIIKMDEDIFVTKNTFNKLLDNYYAAKHDRKKVAFVAPLLNVNGYASTRLLMLTNYLKKAEAKFGKLKFKYGPKNNPAETNPDFVKYMWNYTNEFLSIDKANAMLTKYGTDYDLCPIKFSIGLILYDRKYWEKIGYFTTHNSLDLGTDEILMNRMATLKKYKKIICKNCVCGHLSFGPTNKEMLEAFMKKPEKF